MSARYGEVKEVETGALIEVDRVGDVEIGVLTTDTP